MNTDFTEPGTARQHGLLVAFGRWLVERGAPPSLRDLMAAGVATSTSVTLYNLRRLEEQGFMVGPDPDVIETRAWRLTARGHAWLARQGVVTGNWALEQLAAAGRAVVDDPAPANLAALDAALTLVAA